MTTQGRTEAEETCARMRALLVSLGADDPAPDTLAVLEAHLAGCTTCADAEAALGALIARYRAQEAAPLPAGADPEVVAEERTRRGDLGLELELLERNAAGF